MAAEITARVYDGANPATFIAHLPDAIAHTWTHQLNDSGSGSLKVHEQDDVFAAHPNVLAYTNIVRLAIDGVDRFAFTIENREFALAAPQERAGRWWTVSGRGILALLEDAIVFSEFPIEGSTIRQRFFDWTAAAYDDSTWGDTYYIDHQYPQGWPAESSAVPIWAESAVADPDMSGGSSTQNPAGTCLFRKTFTMPATHDVSIFFSSDDSGKVWFDGEQILETSGNGQIVRFDRLLGAGVHQIAVEATNLAFNGGEGRGPGMILMSVLQHLAGGNQFGTDYAYTLPQLYGGDWVALDYPTPPLPGMPIGQILRLLIEEAQARGALNGITLSFSDALDTNGSAWADEPDIALDIGTSLLDVVRTFVEQFIDVEMTTALELDVYAKGTLGTDKTSGPGTVSLQVGVDFEDLSAAGQSHLVNGVLARDTTGALTTRDDATSLSERKRKEAYLELALAPLQARAQAMSDAVLAEFAYPALAIKFKANAVAGPYTAWRPGDTILIPNPADVATPTTVIALSVEGDSAGHPIYHGEGAQTDTSP